MKALTVLDRLAGGRGLGAALVACAVATGCLTPKVRDRGQPAPLHARSRYFWRVADEPGVVRVHASAHDHSLAPQHLKLPPPRAGDCPAVRVFVHDRELLDDGSAVQVRALALEELQGMAAPAPCSILLRYGHRDAGKFVGVVASTVDGEFAAIPESHGARAAWLLLVPFSAVGDLFLLLLVPAQLIFAP